MVLLMHLGKLDYKNRRRLIFAIYLVVCLLSLSSFTVDAKPVKRHSLSDITNSIHTFVNKQFTKDYTVKTIVGQLDPYLRLPTCRNALEVFYPARAKRMGATTLGVQCVSKEPWKIYIQVQIKVFGPAVVSNQPLPRGTILNKADLTMVNRDISSAMHGYFKSFRDLEGMELKMSVAQGQIIGPRSLKPRHLVKRGDIVTVIAETNGLLIQIKGKALMNGYRGQSIRVKNTRSERVLQGEVISTRTVRVKL